MMTTIDKLFNVDYGQSEYETKENLDKGKTILIASGGEDNGIYGFFDIKSFYKAPLISVPRTGTIGQAFVQEIDCCVSSDALVLIPKEEINLETLYEIAWQIRKLKWKFCYGRKITPDRISKEKIKIVESKINYDKFSKEVTPKQIKKEVIEKIKTKLVKISELCNIEKKNSLPQNTINLEGNNPYVSSSSKNNGVVLFTDEEPNSEGGALTIAKDGNDGYSFFQPLDFITSLHNYVLTPKDNYPKSLLIYIGAAVRKRAYCYNHYYPLNKRHVENMEIPMPINNKEEYDFEYIEKLVKNSYGFRELKSYL